MNSAIKIHHESLSPQTSEEIQHLLQQLSADDKVSVDLSPVLAWVIAKFLSVTLETGAVAFLPVSLEITPEQAGEMLNNELFR
ncbi:hypothetical protein RWA02_02610 [Sinorhizobium meliloti]|uniref:hypothetical protein n=1 Tax=Rhizobium meliloti TaxID=382 RepID=UPI00299EDDBF|nr:hypothetical protein [Sinorhizobium meliloti]MDW9996993.1 hypothetical protein [Sinorhizobium meliloti]